jgi:hypothetical protein
LTQREEDGVRRSVAVLAMLVTGVGLVVSGCGGSDGSRDEEAATPAEAIAEVGQVRTLLDRALAKYRAGNAKQAEQIVGDAYLEHFEHVEGPLEDRDNELKEDLEETISTELRDKIKSRAPIDEVAELVEHAKEHLDEAETALGEAA